MQPVACIGSDPQRVPSSPSIGVHEGEVERLIGGMILIDALKVASSLLPFGPDDDIHEPVSSSCDTEMVREVRSREVRSVTLIHDEACDVLVGRGLGKDLAFPPSIDLEVHQVHDTSLLSCLELVSGRDEFRGVGVEAMEDGRDDCDVILVALFKHLHPLRVGCVLRVDDVELQEGRFVMFVCLEGAEEMPDASSLHGHLVQIRESERVHGVRIIPIRPAGGRGRGSF